jgi:predicted nucleotide-binding protein
LIIPLAGAAIAKDMEGITRSAVMKPRVFIGSSSEQVDTAYAIQRNLERACEATVWDQGVFQLTSNVLDDLMAVLDRTDFGIFVFGPDDLTTIRDTRYQSTRDNVVFELGLFIGKLGKARTFFIMPRERGGFRLPSDLFGTTPAEFDETREDRQAALGPACSAIRQRIGQIGIRADRLTQPIVERITVKSVLCISSPRYEKLGV